MGLLTPPTAIVVLPAGDTLFHLAFPRPGNSGSETSATIAVPLLLAVSLLSTHLVRVD